MTRPPHHDPAGGFRNPWVDGHNHPRGLDFWRWRWQRLRHPPTPAPRPADRPRARPDPAVPRGTEGLIHVTWIGHATALLQLGPVNVLTDPVWSRRVSPLSRMGPGRLVPPGLAFGALPPVDAVVLSHDHYDHLDAPTVRRLAADHPDATWITPLGYAAWLARRGVRRTIELDWWQEAILQTRGGMLRVRALPARHWTRRGPLDLRRRLWAAFALSGPAGERAYFGGDSGWMPEFTRIGRSAGPFDVLLLPIGAYAPRWFMRSSHMTPEEAVAAYRQMGEHGLFVGIHWGTFRLADEPVLEPPERTRAAWRAAGLPGVDLALPAPGGTVCRRIARLTSRGPG
jgi:N-acyl-phosphatidylethanolamine-hydrolysing phospholipase D